MNFTTKESTAVEEGFWRILSVKMEWRKWETYRCFAYSAIQILERLHHELPQSPSVLLDLGFFEMFLRGLPYWEESQHDWRLLSCMINVGRKLRQAVEEFTAQYGCADVGNGITNWELRSYHLERTIQQYKPQVKEICTLLLDEALRCKSCPQEEKLFLEYGEDTASFIEFVGENLDALKSKIHPIAPVKQQIKVITRYLKVFRKHVFWDICRVKMLGEHITQTRTWVNHLSCIACLHWVDRMDESVAPTLATMLSDFMQKPMPYTPGIITSYLEECRIQQYKPQVKEICTILLGNVFRWKSCPHEKFFLEYVRDTASFIEFVRENLDALNSKFREFPAVDPQINLIFLLSFMMNPPEEDSEDRALILGQIHSIINELPPLICSIHSNEMKERISETKLPDFLEKIAGVEVKVRKLYAVTPNSSQFNFPRTNAIGFLDSLIQKLEKWLDGEVNLIARVKHGIQTVWEELASLKEDITKVKNEQEELKNLWNRIVDVVYYAAYVTNLCPARSFSIWYGIIYLPSVIEEIKLLKNEVREIKVPQTCTHKILAVEMKSRDTLLRRTTTSKVEGACIGFKEETKSIIDDLIGGRKDLTIISISGMPGQGKTTLAKRIYNDPKIQCRFHKTMWSYVSKECNIRDLMIHLVRDVSETDDEDISKLGIYDLAERLRKCLKGRRYLFVMDDIWDDGVWCQVRSSFPDDKNGSRILFTSRNGNLISQDQWNFISYPLGSFSDEESWDLMTEKLNGLGTEFEVIGKEIAKNCKGLPLAVALVASLLEKTEQKLELWKQVAEKLKSHLDSEGCMHIIELSFKYLPEHLKSCFLYFGAFQRGQNIRAKRLKLLWIAEGFVKENEKQCSKDLADECLDYLVSQSLVVVAKRSSMGGTKECNVHDLLYDLCLKKIGEDNFLHWVDKNTILNESSYSPQKYGHHRLCIGESDPLIEARPIRRRKELPTSLVQSLLWFERFSGIYGVNSGFLKSFEVLTVLDLESVEMKGDVFPEVILCNIHLRYLALQGSFSKIPPSIAELWNLETLILRGFPLYPEIPDTLWRMKSLRHVIIEGSCVRLEDFEGNESYVAALDNNIETLGGLIPDQPTAEFLGRMKRLRKLQCWVVGDVLFSIFGSLENLEELQVRGYSVTYFPLKLFKLKCSSFPQNKNLRKLSLEDLDVASWSEMSTIGKQFPNLEVLKLVSVMSSKRWELEDGELSKLRYLKLSRLYNLEEINVYHCDNPFPCLEVLLVKACLKLKEIPSEIGDIGSLNTIKMSECSRKASESVMRISEQQRELGNESLQVFVKNVLSDDDDDDEAEDEETERKAEAIESDDDAETEFTDIWSDNDDNESDDDEETELRPIKRRKGKSKAIEESDDNDETEEEEESN